MVTISVKSSKGIVGERGHNIYLNDIRFLVRVSSISYFILQFVHTLKTLLELKRGRRGRDDMDVGFTTTCAFSAYSQDVRSNPVHGEVYSIQHYVIKFVCDMRHVGRFLPFSLS